MSAHELAVPSAVDAFDEGREIASQSVRDFHAVRGFHDPDEVEDDNLDIDSNEGCERIEPEFWTMTPDGPRAVGGRSMNEIRRLCHYGDVSPGS